MTEPCICEKCGQEAWSELSPRERVWEKCEELGIQVRPLDDTVSESAACLLLGYRSDDALRKRIEEGKDLLPFKADRNGRRRYSLSAIGEYLYGK